MRYTSIHITYYITKRLGQQYTDKTLARVGKDMLKNVKCYSDNMHLRSSKLYYWNECYTAVIKHLTQPTNVFLYKHYIIKPIKYTFNGVTVIVLIQTTDG